MQLVYSTKVRGLFVSGRAPRCLLDVKPVSADHASFRTYPELTLEVRTHGGWQLDPSETIDV